MVSRGSRLQPPFAAYAGSDPYIFASYARSDAERVYLELRRLHAAGHRIWYDEGIEPGAHWPDRIARALSSSALVIVFVTPSSAASVNVGNEVDFALNAAKPLVAVHLEPTQLPPGLQLRMGNIQAILRYGMDDAAYESQLARAFAPLAGAREQPQTGSPPENGPRPRRRRGIDFGSLG